MTEVTLYQPGTVATADEQLAQLADQIRTDYPRCKAAFAEFQAYRFAIGWRLLAAREVIAHGLGGRRTNNREGRNQHWEVKLDTLSNLTSDKGLNRQGGARNDAEAAGLMRWCRTEFPDISYRTLSRYREWVEYDVLPAIQECKEQLQLQLGDPMELDVMALPAPKRAELASLLKRATTTRDMMLTLRSMEDASGNPDSWGPRGGDHNKRDADGNVIRKPKLTPEEQLAESRRAAAWRIQRAIGAIEDLEEKDCVYGLKSDLRKLLQCGVAMNHVLRKALGGGMDLEKE